MLDKSKLDKLIFREYDIRGITDTNLTEEVVQEIGSAFAQKMHESGTEKVVTGRDGRLSSESIEEALTHGLVEGGVEVLSVGQVPTPILYYATNRLNTGTGIMITGSHNPPKYNGLKMMLNNKTLYGDAIQVLYSLAGIRGRKRARGATSKRMVSDLYQDEIKEQLQLKKELKVVVDCGNGVAGEYAPSLLKEIGADVVELYCDVDGTFPNHHPDPAEPENLQDLINRVKSEEADIGLAFDGDGDRLGVISNTGQIIWPDKLMMLFSKHVLNANPGAAIISDVKCSMDLAQVVQRHQGKYMMWRTGHSHIKSKMAETGALLGGEFSGHICFRDKWYGYDDALYAAARLLEILANSDKSAHDLFSEFPIRHCTPEIKIETTESRKFEIIDALSETLDIPNAKINPIDGVRIEYENFWGLIRASNTSPVLVLRFEAANLDDLVKVQRLLLHLIRRVAPELTFDVFEGP